MVLLFLVHAIDVGAMLVPALEPFELFGEHLVSMAGFVLIALGARELYALRENWALIEQALLGRRELLFFSFVVVFIENV